MEKVAIYEGLDPHNKRQLRNVIDGHIDVFAANTLDMGKTWVVT